MGETPKVFCIGRNKTGTTSLAAALRDLGLRVGSQQRGEQLLEAWAERRFRPIARLAATADAFQDVPFSLDYTFQAMDFSFPGSRFVLTLRRSPEEWFASLTRFHTRIVGKGRLPTPDDLKEFPYRAPGWIWRAQQLVYGIDEETLYDREIYLEHYRSHETRVRDYFRHRPGDLLVLDVSATDALPRLSTFLGLGPVEGPMPHLNRST
ncbi:MAG: hypothetical protein FJW79_01725 [Actinobacteria bacterium]|nr:hypothetical protein [Actinomycetota bacterium]